MAIAVSTICSLLKTQYLLTTPVAVATSLPSCKLHATIHLATYYCSLDEIVGCSA